MTSTAVVRIGAKQHKKLMAMAASNNISIADFLNILVDNAKDLRVRISIETLVDREFERRIQAYKTLEEAEDEYDNDTK